MREVEEEERWSCNNPEQKRGSVKTQPLSLRGKICGVAKPVLVYLVHECTKTPVLDSSDL